MSEYGSHAGSGEDSMLAMEADADLQNGGVVPPRGPPPSMNDVVWTAFRSGVSTHSLSILPSIATKQSAPENGRLLFRTIRDPFDRYHEEADYRSMRISGCALDMDFVIAFVGEVLPRCPNLTSLDLTYNIIDEQAAQLLFSAGLPLLPKLENLYMEGNPLRPEGIQHLRIVPDAPRGPSCALISRLGLQGCKLGDPGLTTLVNNLFTSPSPIVYLNIRQNEITDGGVRHLAETAFKKNCPSLRRLHLSENRIGDDGIAALATHGLPGLPDLRDLLIAYCDFGDPGMRVLSRHLVSTEKLEWLDFAGNRVGDEGALELSATLPLSCPSLKKLYLANNHDISGVGMTPIAVAMFQTGRCEVLWGVSLCLYCDELGLPSRFSKAKNHEILRLSRPGVVADEVRTTNAEEQALRDEYWRIEQQVMDDLDEALKKALKETFEFKFTVMAALLSRIGQIPLEPIVRRLDPLDNNLLQMVELRNCGLDDSWVTSFVTNGGFAHLGSLHTLDLSRNNIGDIGITAIAGVIQEACPHLRSLDLCMNDITGVGMLELCAEHALQGLIRLEGIDFSFNNITDDGLEGIIALLRAQPMLISVDIGYNKITTEAIISFAEVGLPYCTSLKFLYVNDNNIRKRGRLAIARAVKEHLIPTIDTLWGCALSEHCIDLNLPKRFKKERNAQIFTYLRSQQRKGSEQMRFAKVIVTGPPYAGKTTLIERIISDTYPERLPGMTPGVDMREHDEGGVELRFVDFGGQQVYSHTHRLFLSARAVYIVAYDPRYASGDHEQLRQAVDYGRDVLTVNPGAKIIFVATKSDEGVGMPEDVVERQLRGVFGSSFFAWHSISSRGGIGFRGARGLVPSIIRAAGQLFNMPVKVPAPFRSLSNNLGTLTRQASHPLHISWERFKELAVDNGFEQDEELLMVQALNNFDEWGIVLRLPSEDINTTYIIVRQQELANVLSLVISPRTDKSEDLRAGLLRHAELGRIWGDYDVNLHLGFLRLIHSVGLGFPILFKQVSETEMVDSGATLIPAMLAAEETDGAARNLETLRGDGPDGLFDGPPFRIRLDFVPETVLATFGARFLVHLRQLVPLNGWWKAGTTLLLESGGRKLGVGKVEWNLTAEQPYLMLMCWGSALLPERVFAALDEVRRLHNTGMKVSDYTLFCDHEDAKPRKFDSDSVADAVSDGESLKCRTCGREHDAKAVYAFVHRFLEPFRSEEEDEEHASVDTDEVLVGYVFEPLPLDPRLVALRATLEDEDCDADTLRYRIAGSLRLIHRATCERLDKVEGPKVTWLLFRPRPTERNYFHDRWYALALQPIPNGGFGLSPAHARLPILNAPLKFRTGEGENAVVKIQQDPLSELCGAIMKHLSIPCPNQLEYLGVFRHAYAEGISHRVRELARNFYQQFDHPEHGPLWVFAKHYLLMTLAHQPTANEDEVRILREQINREVMPRTPILLFQEQAKILRKALKGQGRVRRPSSPGTPPRESVNLFATPMYLYFVCPVSRKIAFTNNGNGFKFYLPNASSRIRGQKSLHRLGVVIKWSARIIATVLGLSSLEQAAEEALSKEISHFRQGELVREDLEELFANRARPSSGSGSIASSSTTSVSTASEVPFSLDLMRNSDAAWNASLREGLASPARSVDEESELGGREEPLGIDFRSLRVTGEVPYLDDDMYRGIMIDIVLPAMNRTEADLRSDDAVERFGLEKVIYEGVAPDTEPVTLWVDHEVAYDQESWMRMCAARDPFVLRYRRVRDERKRILRWKTGTGRSSVPQPDFVRRRSSVSSDDFDAAGFGEEKSA